VLLPATYDHIDISRIDFHNARLTPGTFAGNQRRARTTEQIEDQVECRSLTAALFVRFESEFFDEAPDLFLRYELRMKLDRRSAAFVI